MECLCGTGFVHATQRLKINQGKNVREKAIPLEVLAYALPGDGVIERCPQRDGGVKWAIRRSGSCMNNEGEWEFEPMPSGRDDEFLARCRYESAEAAYAAWAQFN